jgi:hypothetical protein
MLCSTRDALVKTRLVRWDYVRHWDIPAVAVFDRSGMAMSDLHAAQPKVKAAVTPTLCLYLHAAYDTLDVRLDARVDGMVRQGLLLEVLLLHVTLMQHSHHPHCLAYDAHHAPHEARSDASNDSSHIPQASSSDLHLSDELPALGGEFRTGGLHESIGFREFCPALFALRRLGPTDVADLHIRTVDSATPINVVLAENARVWHALAPASTLTVADMCSLLTAAVANIKTNTRRYARRQTRWVANRFYAEGLASNSAVPIFCLPSDPARWDELITQPAFNLTRAFLEGQALPPVSAFPPPDLMTRTARVELAQWQKFVCDKCDGRILNGSVEWAAHLKSKAHRSRKKAAAAFSGHEHKQAKCATDSS